MPRFDFNPADAVAGIPIYDSGEYHVILGEPVSFYRPGKNGKEDNYGIMFRSKIAEGAMKDKPYMANAYMHTEESRGFSKQLQMAALGFDPKKPDDEDRFNAEIKSDPSKYDFGFNSDDKSAASGWHLMKGQVIVITLEKKLNQETGDPQNQQKSVRPFTI